MPAIEELVDAPERWVDRAPAFDEFGPLTFDGSFVEAQLTAIKTDPIESTAALLVDLRRALQWRGADAAAIVLRGVSRMTWSAAGRTRRYARTILEWAPRVLDGEWTLNVGLFDAGTFEIAAADAYGFVGTIRNLAREPDFGVASRAEMAAGLPGWGADLVISQAGMLSDSRRTGARDIR